MKTFFRHREHQMPELNLASLPDLIFTVLFFFMIVTHMRDVELKVRYQVPQATEIQKLTHKSAVSYIYVGRMQGNTQDNNYYIQLNDKVVAMQADQNTTTSLEAISQFIDAERQRMSSEDLTRMTVSIKADRDVPMGIIADIKKTLQNSYALKINYSATEK